MNFLEKKNRMKRVLILICFLNEACLKNGKHNYYNFEYTLQLIQTQESMIKNIMSNDLKQAFSYAASNKTTGSELKSVTQINPGRSQGLVVGQSVCDIGLLLALKLVDTGSLKKKNLFPNCIIAKYLRTWSKSPGTSSLATFPLKK